MYTFFEIISTLSFLFTFEILCQTQVDRSQTHFFWLQFCFKPFAAECGPVFIIPSTTLMTLFYPFTKLLLVLLWYSLCKSTEYSSRNLSFVEDRKELLLSFTWHYYYIVVGCSIFGRFSFRQIWCHIDLSLTEQCSQSVFFSASAFFYKTASETKGHHQFLLMVTWCALPYFLPFSLRSSYFKAMSR